MKISICGGNFLRIVTGILILGLFLSTIGIEIVAGTIPENAAGNISTTVDNKLTNTNTVSKANTNTVSKANTNTVSKANTNFYPFADEYMVTGSEYGSAFYYPSNGNGIFGTKSVVYSSRIVDGITIADFDNDGDLDFVMGDGNTDSIILFRNDGGGVYTPITIATAVLGSTPFFSQFRAADFNGDGKMDFIAGGFTTSPNRQFVFINLGNNAFAPSPIDVSWRSGYIFVKEVGDFNNDGMQDMLIGDIYGTSSGKIFLYKGNGDGTFQTPVLAIDLLANHGQKDPIGLAGDDFDLDGKLDIVIGGDGTSGSSHGEFWFYKGNGDGTFTPGPTVFNLKGSGMGQVGIDAFDFNKDGKSDIIGYNWNGGQIWYVKGKGDGSFENPILVEGGLSYGVGIAAPPDKTQIGTVKVVQIDALDNIAIRDNSGNDITDPVWKKTFDANGNLIDVSPKEDDPIADNMDSGKFKIGATLQGFPNDPSWTPKVEYTWSIQGTSASGSNSFNGLSGSFEVTDPQKVGKYTLSLTFKIKDNQGNVISNQQIDRTLYVTYGVPITSEKPKLIWLDKATEWANGAKTKVEAASFLNTGEYQKAGWLYGYATVRCPIYGSWPELVEGTASCGDCVSFSDIWNNLNKVLGVGGSFTQRTQGSKDKGFMTKPATALDGMKGNAHTQGGSIDRWMFSMHQVGKYDGKYYDPTFGNQYSGIFDFIEWHQISEDWYIDWSVLKNRVDLTGGHYVYRLGSGNNGWGNYEYHSPSIPTNIITNEGANFTGNYYESGVDMDSDGLFNYLTTNVEVNVKIAGNYSILGSLKSGITSRSSKDSTIPSGYYLSSGTGLRNVILNFSGQDIYDSGIDGEYTLDLVLLDENGIVIDNKSFNTKAYDHSEFREIHANLESSTDYGEDTDGDGLYDYLSTDISINVIKPTKYSVEGGLYSSGNLITTVYSSTDLVNGINNLKLKFNGADIWKSKSNGPYAMVVTLYDENSQQIDDKEYTTSAYSYTEFQQPPAYFRNIYSDYGVDTDSDGLYNFLTTNAEVNIKVPGTYTILGWLSDSNSDIIWDKIDINLVVGVQSLELNFDGKAIYKHGSNGPYKLSFIALYDNNGNLVDSQRNIYSTFAYKYTDFQKPDNLFIDTEVPKIESITLYPVNTTAGATINISVDASDNVGVTEVTADDIPLSNIDGLWKGTITAASTIGSHSITVKAKDLAGNFAEKTMDYKVLERQGGASISIVPRSNNIVNGNSIDINIKAKNTQNVDDTFRVYLNVSEIPVASRANIGWFNWTEKVINIRAGEEITMPIKISIPTEISGTKAFRARVNSTTSTKVYALDTGSLKIT